MFADEARILNQISDVAVTFVAFVGVARLIRLNEPNHQSRAMVTPDRNLARFILQEGGWCKAASDSCAYLSVGALARCDSCMRRLLNMGQCQHIVNLCALSLSLCYTLNAPFPSLTRLSRSTAPQAIECANSPTWNFRVALSCSLQQLLVLSLDNKINKTPRPWLLRILLLIPLPMLCQTLLHRQRSPVSRLQPPTLSQQALNCPLRPSRLPPSACPPAPVAVRALQVLSLVPTLWLLQPS